MKYSQLPSNTGYMGSPTQQQRQWVSESGLFFTEVFLVTSQPGTLLAHDCWENSRVLIQRVGGLRTCFSTRSITSFSSAHIHAHRSLRTKSLDKVVQRGKKGTATKKAIYGPESRVSQEINTAEIH